MASGKEIRNKIKTVKNTQKITRAMQMVSTSKMKKTQDVMQKARPYATAIRRVISDIAYLNEASKNEIKILRSSKEVKKSAIILITTDKGLCGGLNYNVLKVFLKELQKNNQKGILTEVSTFGQKGLNASKRVGAEIVSSTIAMGDKPSMNLIIGPINDLINKFINKEIDEVSIVYSKFINTMKQTPVLEKLLPLDPNNFKHEEEKSFDYIYEPSMAEVLNSLVQRYIESVVYQCIADNMASEQASRMVAMKAATDNASNLVNKLNLKYNKSRQAAITTELAEIVAGSASIK